MEFDNNAKPASDEDRRLAETKKLTVQPIHTHVEPEAISDSVIASQHINGTPIANVRTDVEQETPPIVPSQEILESIASARTDHSSSHTKGLVIAAIIVVAVFIVGFILMTIRF